MTRCDKGQVATLLGLLSTTGGHGVCYGAIASDGRRGYLSETPGKYNFTRPGGGLQLLALPPLPAAGQAMRR